MGKNCLFLIFQQIMPLMAGYAYLLDKDGHYQACTRSQALLFGLKNPNNIVNQTSKNLPLYRNHPELLNTLDAINHQIKHSKTALQFDEPIKNQEGKLMVVKYHKIPLFDQNHLLGILSLVVDEHSNSALLYSPSPNELALKRILTHLPEHVY